MPKLLWMICAGLLIIATPARELSAENHPPTDKVLVFGNVLGKSGDLSRIMRAAGIIDHTGAWTAGDTTVVGLGDMLAGSVDAGSLQMIKTMQSLSDQAAAAGGRAVWVLGDREIEAIADEEMPEDARQWLMELPIVVTVGDTAFVHGGLSKTLTSGSLDEVNQSLRTKLTENVSSFKTKQNPVFYQGTAFCHQFGESGRVETALAQIGAARAVIGHGYEKIPYSLFDGQVYQLGTDGSSLLVEGDTVSQMSESGDLSPIHSKPMRRWPFPGGMTEPEVLDFLETAPVVKSEFIGTGVTKPKRLTLSDGKTTMRAVFKYYDTDPALEKSVSFRRIHNKADRFLYEIAAYRLDRMLNLQMVPVTVERTVESQPGVVQLWVEDVFTENDRQDGDIAYTGKCNLNAQYDIMNAFDILIYNDDRNQGNVLYTQDWQIFLIDHTRAFSSRSGRPKILKKTKLKLQPMFADALSRLTDESLKSELSGLLHARQIQGLHKRRDELLKSAN